MNTEDRARTYYSKINAKDLEGLLALFAEDATFTLPDGRKVSGMAEIRKMYVNVFAHGGPQPQPMTFIASDSGVAVEVQVNLADGSVRNMASFFQVGSDEKFISIGVYQRAG